MSKKDKKQLNPVVINDKKPVPKGKPTLPKNFGK